MSTYRIFTLTAALAFFSACGKDSKKNNDQLPPAGPPPALTFTADINSILVGKCGGCHGAASEKLVKLVTEADARKWAQTILMRVNQPETELGYMPKGAAPLSVEEKQKLQTFLDDGKQPAPVAGLTFVDHVLPIVKAKCTPCHELQVPPPELPRIQHSRLAESEAAFKKWGYESVIRINLAGDETGHMPLGESKKPERKLTDAEKGIIQHFLGINP